MIQETNRAQIRNRCSVCQQRLEIVGKEVGAKGTVGGCPAGTETIAGPELQPWGRYHSEAKEEEEKYSGLSSNLIFQFSTKAFHDWIPLRRYRVKELRKCHSLKYRTEQKRAERESDCIQAINWQWLTLLSSYHKPSARLSAFYD